MIKDTHDYRSIYPYNIGVCQDKFSYQTYYIVCVYMYVCVYVIMYKYCNIMYA